MSDLGPATENAVIVEEASDRQTETTHSSDLISKAEKIREELGIVDGQVTLTFLDDGI